jgi:multidrug transporter EmrE-like cation transporter
MSPTALWAALSVAGFIVAQTAAALCFKAGAGADLYTLRWWLWFAAGNATGFGCPVALSFALRGTNANLVYAASYGGGFCLIQLATWWIFREPLSPWQWSGIALIFSGILLLRAG